MRAKKPGYDSEAIQGELVERVCTFFGRVFDDYEAERHAALRGHRPRDEKWLEIMGEVPTISETAEEFGVTPMKVRKLLITGRISEVCGRSADIVNISLKSGHFGNDLCFSDYAFNTARAHASSLMKGKRTEIAGTEAASVMSY